MRDSKTKVHGTGTIQVKAYVPKPYDEPAEGPKLVRISVTETFSGGVEGEGTVEFLQLLRSDGSASFVGLERVVGKVGGRSGSLVLQDAVRAAQSAEHGSLYRGRGPGSCGGCVVRAGSPPKSASGRRSRLTIGSSSFVPASRRDLEAPTSGARPRRPARYPWPSR
jgi:Protein of unknown function (DUF3224)